MANEPQELLKRKKKINLEQEISSNWNLSASKIPCLMQIYSYDFVNITFLQRNDFTKDFKAISKNAFFSKFTNFF